MQTKLLLVGVLLVVAVVRLRVAAVQVEVHRVVAHLAVVLEINVLVPINPSLVEIRTSYPIYARLVWTQCGVTVVANGTGCLNAAGTFVSNASICSDPANARESDD